MFGGFATHAAAVGGGSILNVALTVGAAFAGMMIYGGNISGGHFNPVFSLVHALDRTISLGRCLIYIGAQFAGSLFGGLMLLLTLHDTGETNNYGTDPGFLVSPSSSATSEVY